jgi:DNA gyrase subunit A
MAQQLNFLSVGNVIPTALHTEMEQSYLEYAMSVIVGRALPDARDGLKPVHRRILYAMHELGLTPDKPYRKCARVVGDVLGKYHPHGDQAVYDALVRMVQGFSSRYPLLDGHGNFGSIDDDPPAAMRYTETRLSGVSHSTMLENIGDATVNFTENFDNSQQEPIVLPAQLPNLLLNGCSGIAVGMATNIPPHNLGEVVDALVALIDRPDMSDEALMQFIPAPDFPTGGEILDTQGIEDAYLKGRGSIPIRAISSIEEIQIKKGRHRKTAIIITELPFQVNKAGLLEKIAALINQGKIEGISDLRDESDRDGMRMVIELKRDINPQSILEKLYRQTPLQSNFGVIMLALVNGQPVQLTLKGILEEFLAFREETMQREYQFELDKTQMRAHIVEGLLIALNDLDPMIEILRQAADGSTAKVALQEQLDLSDRQADAILSMPMRRVTGMERQNLESEFKTLQTEIERLESLISDRKIFLKQLKKELKNLKKKFGDPRRTRILSNEAIPVVPPPVISNEPVTLEITQKKYVRALPQNNRSRRKNIIEPAKTLRANQRDLEIFSEESEPSDRLIVFTDVGKAYFVEVQDIPVRSGRERGIPLITMLPESAKNDQIVSHFLRSQVEENSEYIFLTAQGKIKALPASEFEEITNRGLICLKLQEGDRLQTVIQVNGTMDLLIGTSNARMLRFASDEVPVMGRSAMGSKAIKLLKQESIIGFSALEADQSALIVSKRGYVKRFPIDILRQGSPGDLGTQLIQRQKTDEIIYAGGVSPTPVMVCSEDNAMAIADPGEIKLTQKNEPTQPWFKVEKDNPLVQVLI